jgi:uncharacterized protein
MSNQSEQERPMTSGFLGKEVYVVTTRPVSKDPIPREMMRKHLEHQVRLEQEGIMFAAGPLFAPESATPDAGLIVIRAANFDEAYETAMRDPLQAEGYRAFTLHRWIINEGSYTVRVTYSDQRAAIE